MAVSRRRRTPLAAPFCDAAAQHAVAAIVRQAGFDCAHRDALSLLSLAVQTFLTDLAATTTSFANHAQRTVPNAADLRLALMRFRIPVPDLARFLFLLRDANVSSSRGPTYILNPPGIVAATNTGDQLSPLTTSPIATGTGVTAPPSVSTRRRSSAQNSASAATSRRSSTVESTTSSIPPTTTTGKRLTRRQSKMIDAAEAVVREHHVFPGIDLRTINPRPKVELQRLPHMVAFDSLSLNDDDTSSINDDNLKNDYDNEPMIQMQNAFTVRRPGPDEFDRIINEMRAANAEKQHPPQQPQPQPQQDPTDVTIYTQRALSESSSHGQLVTSVTTSNLATTQGVSGQSTDDITTPTVAEGVSAPGIVTETTGETATATTIPLTTREEARKRAQMLRQQLGINAGEFSMYAGAGAAIKMPPLPPVHTYVATPMEEASLVGNLVEGFNAANRRGPLNTRDIESSISRFILRKRSLMYRDDDGDNSSSNQSYISPQQLKMTQRFGPLFSGLENAYPVNYEARLSPLVLKRRKT